MSETESIESILADDAQVNLEAEFEKSNVKEVLDKLDRELIGLVPVKTRIREIVAGTASALGAKATIDWQTGYPVTMNTPENTVYAADVARSISGEVDDDIDPIMPSEDFSYMLEERPGAYILVGNGDTAAVHHPEYNFDDEAIPAGCSWWAGIVEERMPAG